MNKAIETYLPDQFQEIPSKNLMDFLPHVDSKVAKDLNILAIWKAHFRHVNIPYQVRQNGVMLTLWKERRV